MPADNPNPNPLGGTFGVPWDQGRQPYASNDVYRDPYDFDRAIGTNAPRCRPASGRDCGACRGSWTR